MDTTSGSLLLRHSSRLEPGPVERRGNMPAMTSKEHDGPIGVHSQAKHQMQLTSVALWVCTNLRVAHRNLLGARVGPDDMRGHLSPAAKPSLTWALQRSSAMQACLGSLVLESNLF
eukprot:6484342-Amphidinium_carterae.1